MNLTKSLKKSRDFIFRKLIDIDGSDFDSYFLQFFTEYTKLENKIVRFSSMRFEMESCGPKVLFRRMIASQFPR
jgi:hypothetical protein